MKKIIVCITAFFLPLTSHAADTLAKIDRQAVIARHHISEDTAVELEIPLGSGEFCFNVDGTGTQTFRGNTMAHWGWHNFPLPEGFTPGDVPATGTFQQGRNTSGGDHSFPPEKAALRQWMFDNPHRADLARVRLTRADGEALTPPDVTDLKRSMHFWTGLHTSEFRVGGEPVRTETVADMHRDGFHIRMTSLLFAEGKLTITLDFPYPTLGPSVPYCGDFGVPERHETEFKRGAGSLPPEAEPAETADTYYTFYFLRKVDDLKYLVKLWVKNGKPQPGENAHTVMIQGTGNAALEVACTFTHIPTDDRVLDEVWGGQVFGMPGPGPDKEPDFDSRKQETAAAWKAYWQYGAAVDFSESADPRWRELERRVVLSQYLMGANSAGSWPPAETGLMGTDPWRGQFHGEMIYWHLAHYALWDRWHCAEQALGCYEKFMPVAKQLAAQLGYKGAQWPKSAGPEGRTAPWVGNQVLLWKQPHPILFAELEYRQRPTRATLEKWAPIIEATAEFMADYSTRDEHGVYHLRPVMPPSEQGITADTVFDLAYWRWGLQHANVWRQRMNVPKNEAWDEVRAHLAPLPLLPDMPADEAVYVHSAQWHDTYTARNFEHPDPAGVLGMLPPVEGADAEIAARTVRKIADTWRWDAVWGWDFPWMAMAAARTLQPELAVEMLMHESLRNAYDARGVNANNPCPYLPGNGGVLYAVGMMVGGWDGCPEVNREAGETPGFPRDGRWIIRHEGFKPAL